MRIIAGSCRGMNILAPLGQKTRPTLSRVREAVMSMLEPHLGDAVIVDLFAGSGAVGIEAISRGAKACYFVEENRAALTALKKNAEECRRRLQVQNLFPAKLEIIALANTKAWPLLRRSSPLDIIWADPPYEIVAEWFNTDLSDNIDQVSQKGSLLVIEAPRKALGMLSLGLPGKGENWQKIKEKLYGETAILIWERIN